MTLPDNAKLKERLSPMLWQQGYLGMKPLYQALKEFSVSIKKEDAKKILDLGCGVKPYEPLFPAVEKYVGFDVEPHPRVDVTGFNWDLPFEDNEFDALLSTQVLEHTAKVRETVAEIRRVVKPGGLIYISVPLTFPEHGIPYDFYRFTRYGLMEVFKDFEIISLTPHNGYLATLIRLWNAFLNYIPGARFFLFPVFFINNLIALFFDGLAKLLSHLPHPMIKEAYDKVYMGMTESYSMVLRNKK
jgi:SAM-dependent methyltransferase